MRLWPAALLVPLAFLAPLRAQQSKLEREIDFVRDLATKLRFLSLAQSEVDRMLQRYTDPEEFKNVSQLGIEISLIGAKNHPNREERRTQFKDAIERSKKLLERYPDLRSALITLADASLEYGRFLADDIEIARIEAPEKVKDLEAEADQVFRDGVQVCDQAMEALAEDMDKNPRAKTDYHVTWMRKGILLREHARAKKADRVTLADRSRSTLEELVFEVGEETALGQRAMFEYAQNDEVVGEYEDAVRSYTDVIDTVVTALSDESQELPPEVRELMVVTLEEAYDRIAAMLLEQGNGKAVLEKVAEYRTKLEELGVPLTDLDKPSETTGREDEQFGHSLYVTAALAMAESGNPGDIEKATKICQFVNEQHGNDFVGLRAKVALKEILSAPGRSMRGDLLLEVAKGDYLAREYELAIRGCKRAIAAMTPEEGAKVGLEAHYVMAHSFALQGRVLEATLAAKRGLESWGATADEATRERATDLLQKAMRQVRANAADDSYYESLQATVVDLAAKFGSVADAAKLAWQNGGRLLSEAVGTKDPAQASKKVSDAIAAYERVAKESPYYDLARARICRALQIDNRFADARKAIADYRAWLDTPEAQIPNDRADLRMARAEAQAEIDFVEGYVTYLEAIGAARKDGTKDLTKLPQVIELLADYDTKHGSAGQEQMPTVLYVLGRSYVEMGEIDKAMEKYRTLSKLAPRHGNVAGLASAIFNACDAEVTAKLKEVESIAKQGKPELLAKAESELEAARRKTISIGLEYFEGSDDPQFGIAYYTLKHLEALEDWKRIQSFANRVIAVFENDQTNGPKVDEYVRPLAGEALLRDHEYQRAYDMLVAAEKADPKNYPIKRLICLALGGWAEIDKRGNAVTHLGLEKPAEAYDKYWNEYKTYGLNTTRGVEPYTLPWYEYHWELYYFAREAGKKDSKYREWADTIYSKAQSIDNFKALGELPGGKRLQDLFFKFK